MADRFTNSQLNKLGERLRKNGDDKDELRLLDEFRLSFGPAYETVFNHLTSLGLESGGRPAKSTQSIIAKLIREKTRLSTMQDIAGCRVEVANIIEQERVLTLVTGQFPECKIDDRRLEPRHGYRAVHAIVEVEGFRVEIQVRTSLQNSWAQTVERLADRIDPDLKYGGGPESLRKDLARASNVIALFEKAEKGVLQLEAKAGAEVMSRLGINNLESLNEIKRVLQDSLPVFMIAADKEIAKS